MPYQVELLLQLLIGIVYAKLLKTVHIKCLKPIKSKMRRQGYKKKNTLKRS